MFTVLLWTVFICYHSSVSFLFIKEKNCQWNHCKFYQAHQQFCLKSGIFFSSCYTHWLQICQKQTKTNKKSSLLLPTSLNERGCILKMSDVPEMNEKKTTTLLPITLCSSILFAQARCGQYSPDDSCLFFDLLNATHESSEMRVQ